MLVHFTLCYLEIIFCDFETQSETYFVNDNQYTMHYTICKYTIFESKLQKL